MTHLDQRHLDPRATRAPRACRGLRLGLRAAGVRRAPRSASPRWRARSRCRRAPTRDGRWSRPRPRRSGSGRPTRQPTARRPCTAASTWPPPPARAVRAPLSGRVSFAGRVPGAGGGTVLAVTIATASGSVTLMPLASASVKAGAELAEGDSVGTLDGNGDASSAGIASARGRAQGRPLRRPALAHGAHAARAPRPTDGRGPGSAAAAGERSRGKPPRRSRRGAAGARCGRARSSPAAAPARSGGSRARAPAAGARRGRRGRGGPGRERRAGRVDPGRRGSPRRRAAPCSPCGDGLLGGGWRARAGSRSGGGRWPAALVEWALGTGRARLADGRPRARDRSAGARRAVADLAKRAAERCAVSFRSDPPAMMLRQ